MTRRQYVPRAFAPLAMRHFSEQPRCALWAKPGMGKTLLTLTHLDILHRVIGESRPTLVIAPPRVARDTWATEASRWEHLQGLEVVPVVGTPRQRLAALRLDAPIHVTNYEQLPWLCETLGDQWPYATVVADEAHKLKGFRTRQGTARARALGRVIHQRVERVIQLTGTPSANGLADLWGQLWFLDAGQRLGRTYSAFQQRWFRPKPRGGSQQYIQWEPLDSAAEEIHARVADMCLSLDPRDWFDLREPIVNRIEVELPAKARAHYRQLERELFTELAGGEVEAFNAASLSNKCLQMANGTVYLGPEQYGKGAWAAVHDEKLDALDELADATGTDALMVVYWFASDRQRILERWPDALDLADESDLAKAKAGQGKIWLAQPQSVGEGVDGLQAHCNQVVFFSQIWRADLYEQVIERVGPMRQLQAGRDREVMVHHIIARNTTDEAAFARRDGKLSVQEALMRYTKGELG